MKRNKVFILKNAGKVFEVMYKNEEYLKRNRGD